MTPHSSNHIPHSTFRITVLAGGTSAEREVSLGSGRACALALANTHPTRLVEVTANALPPGLDPAHDVIFSTLHGTFGEDGGMQRLLDNAGIHYAGCDASSSALTMDKSATKASAARAGVQVAPEVCFTAKALPSPASLIATLGPRIVIKPNAEGSSVGLHLCDTEQQLAGALKTIAECGPRNAESKPHATWLAEPRLIGRELSIGVLNGRALGVVEIRPKSGVYDYSSKYTKGLTEYFAPAPLPDAIATHARNAAEQACAACKFRDYPRVDLILCPPPPPCEQNGNNPLYLLEINTLPGMKETSLLPMSARCAGLDFTALVRELVRPAIQRFTHSL